MLGERYFNVRQTVKANSHTQSCAPTMPRLMSRHVNSDKLDCAPAMLGHCHALCESQCGCQKNLNC